MGQRITIMIDDDMHNKLRRIQADMLKATNRSISFSHVINEILKKGLK